MSAKKTAAARTLALPFTRRVSVDHGEAFGWIVAEPCERFVVVQFDGEWHEWSCDGCRLLVERERVREVA